MNKIPNFTFLITAFLLLLSQTSGSQPSCDISPDILRITNDVYYLASDELEGRLPGTPGCDLAADYIASEFQNAGLEPITRMGYFQPFEITSGVTPGSGNYLNVNTPDGEYGYAIDTDFLPLFFSPNGEVSGDVVFAGYGITAEEYGWDDYADIDPTGKIVMCFRDEPGKDNPDSPFDGILPTLYSGLRWKTFNALNHGAIGLIVVTGPAYLDEGEEDTFISLDNKGGHGESGIPVIQVSQDVANTLFSTMGAPLSMFHGEIERHGMSFGTLLEDITVEFSVDLERQYVTTKNVAGILRGVDPVLADEWIVIGAHYDHLGWGGEGSLYHGEPAIHNGADDNASGTAGVLELARLFRSEGNQPRRSILFIAFSAEEMGTLGSLEYVNNPIVPLEDTVTMINMDMIGRVRPDDDGIFHCAVHSTGSALEWEEIIPDITPDGNVELRSKADPIGGSDYVNFYLEGIPVLNFFSGIHEDYSRPTDDAEKINYEGMASVIGAVFQIASEISNRDEKLTFQEVGRGTIMPPSEGPSYGVYLGTIPDFDNTGDGFYIIGVNPGSPAEVGGLQADDRIVRVGDFEVTDIYSYTYALGEYEPGDTVEIVVLRDGEEIILTVTFASRGE